MFSRREITKKDRLYIYECHGVRLPESEPADEGYLGIWPEPPFYYLFYDRHSMSSVVSWVRNQKGWLLRDCYELDYAQWQQIPSADYRIGPFVIRTIGGDRDAAVGFGKGVLIKLDPGVVFGSGLHATTRGCLLTIAELYEHCCFRKVLDLGTGTGILALACAFLGSSRVWAVDCNVLSARAAKKNIETNGLEDVVVPIVVTGLDGIRQPADLLVMNIEWPSLKKVLQESSWIDFQTVIMSGLLECQWAELEELLPSKTQVLSRRIMDGWLTLAVSNSAVTHSANSRI